MIRIKNKVLFSPYTSWYVNKTNKKGELLTTTVDGKLIYVALDGRTSIVQFNEFTPRHLFFYEDLNCDHSEEFTYFDSNRLYSYDRFQKALSENTFPAGTSSPFLIHFPSGENKLGMVSPKTSDIYIFGKKGLMPVDPVIRGNTRFDIGLLDAEKGTSLVIGSGKFVKNFILPTK